MKYLNITTARARDPGHSVAPHTGEREQLPTFPFIQPLLLWTFYQPATANPSPPGPGQGCTGGGYFGPVPVLTFVWRGSCCCCCSAYTPGIFKMQARVFCVARNNHEIGCHTAQHCHWGGGDIHRFLFWHYHLEVVFHIRVIVLAWQVYKQKLCGSIFS